MDRRRTLLVFAKAPVAGRVKTRLVPRLGAEGACRLYEGFLADAHDLTAPFPARVVWWVDGDVSTFRRAIPSPGPKDEDLRRQPPGDLGERLAEAFAQAFAEGAEQAAAIGTDCPELTAAHLHALFAALDEGGDAALIPALDGGYAALALARRCDAAFRGVAWSTPRALDDTLARLAQEGMSARLLPPLADVDEPADLYALQARLSQNPLPPCPHTRRALARVATASGPPKSF